MPRRTPEHHKFGLIGKNISYSFSKQYFTEKFDRLGLKTHSYQNFDLASLDDFEALIQNTVNLCGLNVTIPYKEAIMKFLDEIDDEALEIGAVNTIKISNDGKLIGFNTDAFGFENSIKPLLDEHHTKALILGTGGASKAIAFVLKKLKIEVLFVSRNPKGSEQISYHDLTKNHIDTHTILINCTPLGTFPEIKEYPNIPYKHLTEKHLLYDLIYNPAETAFLKKGTKKGSLTRNGYKMLELQAEKAWQIWTG